MGSPALRRPVLRVAHVYPRIPHMFHGEASVMHNLEDLKMGGTSWERAHHSVAWRKDQAFLLVAYHLFFLEISSYTLSLLYIYITYI